VFALTLAFVLAPRQAAAASQTLPNRVASVNRQQPQLAVRTEKNVEYGREAGDPLLLDLYTPIDERPGLRPGIVFIHGGGWTSGDKAEFADKAREMAGRGYVAVSVNYRLAPKHRFPAAVQDVERAVRWLKGRATELRLDPDRIASMGASAGGHLAAMLGLRDTWEKRTGPAETSARVRCVVDYFGRMDLNLEPTGTGMTDYRPAFIGRPKTEAQDLWAEASPITYVDAKTAPFLIVHGAVDPQVEPAQSIKMLAALEKANVEATLVLLGNQGHGFKGPAAIQAWDTAKAFLDRHLLR
jgi:acetyl esterase/lipase